jgi:isoleucyl-tRNA synthetase
MDEATITHVTEIVRSKGTDAWWEMELVDLMPDQYKHRADSLIKGTDTMVGPGPGGKGQGARRGRVG